MCVHIFRIYAESQTSRPQVWV